MTTQTEITRVTEYRNACDRNGYFCVAIGQGQKFPTQPAWGDRALARYWIKHRPSQYFLGTGIITRGLRLIDIDIEDADKVATVRHYLESRFGPAPTRFRENSHRLALIYRAAIGEPAKAMVRNKDSKEAVEILGLGQQVFVDGMHPSGYPLQWRQGSPTATHRDSLGGVTDDEVTALLAFCGDLIGCMPSTPRVACRVRSEPSVPYVGGMGKGDWFIGDVRSALAEITHLNDDHDSWFSIGCAVYAATAGNADGFHAWREWSRSVAVHYSDAARVWFSLGRANNRITAGTLSFRVMEVNPNWVKPSTTFHHLQHIFTHKD